MMPAQILGGAEGFYYERRKIKNMCIAGGVLGSISSRVSPKRFNYTAKRYLQSPVPRPAPVRMRNLCHVDWRVSKPLQQKILSDEYKEQISRRGLSITEESQSSLTFPSVFWGGGGHARIIKQKQEHTNKTI